MIGPVATAAKHLIAFGACGQQLVEALADIEEACLAIMGGDPHEAISPSWSPARALSAGALRTRRYRARLAARRAGVTGASPVTAGDAIRDVSGVTSVTGDGKASQGVTKASRSVTGDASRDGLARANTESSSFSLNPLASESVDISRGDASRHEASRVTFDDFITAYPFEPGQSRLKAETAWRQLSEEDRSSALKACAPFRQWASKQGRNYTMLHAATFLSERRFESFRQEVLKGESVNHGVRVSEGSAAWLAWKAHYAAHGKRGPPSHNGGWYFPSEFPPDDTREQREMRLLRNVS